MGSEPPLRSELDHWTRAAQEGRDEGDGGVEEEDGRGGNYPPSTSADACGGHTRAQTCLDGDPAEAKAENSETKENENPGATRGQGCEEGLLDWRRAVCSDLQTGA